MSFPGGGVFQGDFQSGDWWDFKASPGIGGVSGSGIGGFWRSGLGPFTLHSAGHPKHKKKTQIYLKDNFFSKQLYQAWYLILIFFYNLIFKLFSVTTMTSIFTREQVECLVEVAGRAHAHS